MDETCNVSGCEEPAAWAYIGESGDLYLCDDHITDTTGWVPIG